MAAMKKSKRLEPVAKLAETRQKEAARLLGECRGLLLKHEERLIELIGYRKQYTENFYEVGHAGTSAQKISDYKAFLARLNDGIEQQKQRIKLVRQELEQKKRDWIAVRGKAQAVSKVVDNHVHREKYHEARKEQNEMDEQAQQLIRAKAQDSSAD
jgi:flagellar FliJ protein